MIGAFLWASVEYGDHFLWSFSMAQNNQVAAPVRRYTRLDFAALRYRFNKLPISFIRDRLFTEDCLSERGIETDAKLEAWLDDLRDNLIERARRANPLIAKNLEDARTFNSWPAGTINFLIQAGERDQADPMPNDSLAIWLRPLVSRPLAAEGIVTVSDLKKTIELRGDGWYRPVPRIGRGKALAIERWLSANANTVGGFTKPSDKPISGLVQFSPTTQLVPLERIAAVVTSLDGSQGRNRNNTFCLISARNDLEAVQAYLYRYRGSEKTLRAYRKELERFLLWCVSVRRMPLSSVLLEECEAYKDFLAAPAPGWMGVKVARSSARWKPFERPLSPQSQKYAVQAIRTFFDWLVRVRYLGGNPWATVADPLVSVKETPLDLDKALPDDLWKALSGPAGVLATAVALAPTPLDSVQYRLAHAAIELIGATGIRREEAAGAVRGNLKQVRDPKLKANSNGLWELAVLGKRNKWRTVFMPAYVVSLIRRHWVDRGHDFDSPAAGELALVSPVAIPATPAARAKHLNEYAELTGNGFSPDGLYQVVKTTLIRLARDERIDLSDEARAMLLQAAPHALRHTFATRATADDVPLDVVQRILGHVSQQTTSIYVRAERTRSIKEMGNFFGQDDLG